MNPPLRPREHVDAVLEGLADGTIDAIATDHAPHGATDKDCEFSRAANGMRKSSARLVNGPQQI